MRSLLMRFLGLCESNLLVGKRDVHFDDVWRRARGGSSAGQGQIVDGYALGGVCNEALAEQVGSSVTLCLANQRSSPTTIHYHPCL
jgi:hypothetical protein